MQPRPITPFGKSILAAAGLLAAALPAQAGLFVTDLYFEALAQVVQTDRTGVHETLDHQTRQALCLFNFCATTANGSPGILASAEPSITQRAYAAQDAWGAFGQRQGVTVSNYETGVQEVQGHTYTLFTQRVGTDTANTRLLLDFRWLGSRVAAGTYYGEGLLDASSSVHVVVSRNGGPDEQVWGFMDRTRKVPGGMFSDNHLEWDVQGVGTPARQFETEWREFMIWGDIERGAHFGTFDFGVLNPGESFQLTYAARTDLVMNSVTYAGRGELLLDDPFGLQQPGLRFRDLNYVFADDGTDPPPAGVPEPGSLALLLAAGVLPWWRRGQRSRAANPASARGATD